MAQRLRASIRIPVILFPDIWSSMTTQGGYGSFDLESSIELYESSISLEKHLIELTCRLLQKVRFREGYPRYRNSWRHFCTSIAARRRGGRDKLSRQVMMRFRISVGGRYFCKIGQRKPKRPSTVMSPVPPKKKAAETFIISQILTKYVFCWISPKNLEKSRGFSKVFFVYQNTKQVLLEF